MVGRVSGGGAPTSKWPVAGPAEAGPVEASLKVRRPGLPEVVVPIRGKLVIGRSPALADLVLDDDLVSRRHAELWVDEKGYVRLADLGSRNGVRFLDRMVRRLNLVDGDVFHIGKTELQLSATLPRLAGAQPAPNPRLDTMMVDARITVPEPEPEPDDGLEGIEQLGWRPGPSAGSLEPPPSMPSEPSPGPIEEPSASESAEEDD